MTLENALDQLRAHAEPGRAEGMADYHKVPRDYLGVPNPAINDLTTEWRRALGVEERVALADALWRTNIFEARLAAAKLLTQARITPDDAVWALITAWLPDLDSWAIADHAMTAGQKADHGRSHPHGRGRDLDHLRQPLDPPRRDGRHPASGQDQQSQTD